MAKHPKAFNRLYTKMVAAGEVGGVLDIILSDSPSSWKAQSLKRRSGGDALPDRRRRDLDGHRHRHHVLHHPEVQEIFRDFGVKLRS